MKLRRPTALAIDHWSKPDTGYATMRVTSPFGWRGSKFHGALDIGNGRLGDQVVAAADGVVAAVGNLRQPWSEPTSRFPSGNYGGLMIVLEHAHDAVTIYAHLRDERVTAGQRVSAGQLIGHVGDTGSAAPPPLGGGGHLHFGVKAPAAQVPAGVATARTSFGIGLDVDPWPLITGAAELGARFSDVPPDHTFAGDIAWLADEGITAGTPDGEFLPDQPVTRGQFAAFLHRHHRKHH